MVFESTSGTTSSQVPKTESLVPRTRKSVISVWWENNVTYEVGVPIQTFLWDTVVKLVTCKVPHDQRFIYEKQWIRLISDSFRHDYFFLRLRNTSNTSHGESYLPREQDKIISVCIGLVAIWVTHPLCPRRVPRSCIVSVILNDLIQN